MKRITTTILLATAAALAACSPTAQNESAEAANAIGSDVRATTSNAINDVDAATDQALGSAETKLDNAGVDLQRGADRAGAAIGNTADRAAHATGEALTDVGNSLKK